VCVYVRERERERDREREREREGVRENEECLVEERKLGTGGKLGRVKE